MYGVMLYLERILPRNYKSLNDKGFTVMTMVLVMGLVLSILILSFVSYFANQNKQNMAQKIKIDYANLQTVIQMISSSPAACKQNIHANFFGVNMSQLSSLSASGDIKIAAATPGSILLSKTVDYSGVIAKKISFGAPTTVLAGDFDYVMDLNIEVVDKNSISISRLIKIPFYISTDSTGKITECLATMYPDDTVAAPIPTAEDILCQKLEDDPSKKYVPNRRACI